MKKSHLIIFFFLLIILFSSCSKQNEIQENTLIKIYAEMVFMEDSTTLSKQEIKSAVLSRFEISEKDFDNTVKNYSDKPDKWQKFLDNVIAYIDTLQKKSKKPKP